MTAIKQARQQDHRFMLIRLRKLARYVCEARNAESYAKERLEQLRPDMVELFHALGINIVQVSPRETVQLVEPVTRRHDEQAIEAYIKRYRPELYDTLFPPVRKLDTGKLRDAIDSGAVSRKVEKHIHDVQGTPQLRRTVKYSHRG